MLELRLGSEPGSGRSSCCARTAACDAERRSDDADRTYGSTRGSDDATPNHADDTDHYRAAAADHDESRRRHAEHNPNADAGNEPRHNALCADAAARYDAALTGAAGGAYNVSLYDVIRHDGANAAWPNAQRRPRKFGKHNEQCGRSTYGRLGPVKWLRAVNRNELHQRCVSAGNRAYRKCAPAAVRRTPLKTTF